MSFACRLRKLKPFPSKLRQVKESGSCEASDGADLGKLGASGLVPPPMPLPLEERWKRVMKSYHDQSGKSEHEVGAPKVVPGLLKFCGTCGLMEVDEMEGIEEKGRYNYEHHPLSRAERRKKRIDLANYILEEVVETERVIKSYLRGEIG